MDLLLKETKPLQKTKDISASECIEWMVVFELEITEVVGFYLVSEVYSRTENLLRFCSVSQMFIECLLCAQPCVQFGAGEVGTARRWGEQQPQSQPDWL